MYGYGGQSKDPSSMAFEWAYPTRISKVVRKFAVQRYRDPAYVEFAETAT
jgi:hypothetical protein